MIVMNFCDRAADLAAAVKLVAIDANWFSGTYCRN